MPTVTRLLAGCLIPALFALPAAAQLPYAESFDGTDGDPWPAPWTTMSFHLLDADLQGNRGRMQGAEANGSGSIVARMLLPGFSETDIEATLTLEFEDVANQGIGFYARQNGGTLQEYLPHGEGYALFLKGGWGWPDDLGLWREIDGVESEFATGYNPVAGGLQDGVRYRLRFRVTQANPDSTLVQARIWVEGNPEPGAWTVEAYDTTPELQGTPGSFALDIYNFQGTNRIFVDDLTIVPYPNTVSTPVDGGRPGAGLSAPSPNPVRGAARFGVRAPEAGRLRVTLHSVTGRRVADLFEGTVPEGETIHSLRPAELGLAAGVYLLRTDGVVRAVRRIVVLD
jgi:hypothetical protein